MPVASVGVVVVTSEISFVKSVRLKLAVARVAVIEAFALPLKVAEPVTSPVRANVRVLSNVVAVLALPSNVSALIVA